MTDGPSILYLEDEIIIALDTSETLRSIGFGKVKTVHSLRRATEAGTDFDAALLDVNLGSGLLSLDLGRELLGAGVPVVFASGYNKGEMEAEHPDLVFLEKPLAAEVLREAWGALKVL